MGFDKIEYGYFVEDCVGLRLYVTKCVVDDRVLLNCQWLGVGLLIPAKTLICVSQKIQ